MKGKAPELRIKIERTTPELENRCLDKIPKNIEIAASEPTKTGASQAKSDSVDVESLRVAR